MSSFLDNLLTQRNRQSKAPKKCVSLSVTGEVHEAFGRACKAGGVNLSACVEAMMLDFIRQRTYAPEQLREIKFVGTADRYAKNRKEQVEGINAILGANGAS